MSMVKHLSMASVLFAQAIVEPLTGGPDVVRYAITQGGLLAVVLVLLWMIKAEARRNEQSLRTEGDRKEERLEVMTTLVEKTVEAMTRQSDSSERVALALENLERRGRNR